MGCGLHARVGALVEWVEGQHHAAEEAVPPQRFRVKDLCRLERCGVWSVSSVPWWAGSRKGKAEQSTQKARTHVEGGEFQQRGGVVGRGDVEDEDLAPLGRQRPPLHARAGHGAACVE